MIIILIMGRGSSDKCKHVISVGTLKLSVCRRCWHRLKYQSLISYCLLVFSSEPYYQANAESRLGEENKGHQLLTKMGKTKESQCAICGFFRAEASIFFLN